jgi:potassium efflux system protein
MLVCRNARRHRRSIRGRLFGVAIVLLVVVAGRAVAQGPTADPAEGAVTRSMIQGRLQAVESNEQLSAAERDQAAELYRQSLTHLEAAEGLRATRLDWQSKTERIEAELEDQRRQQAELAATSTEPTDPTSLEQGKLDEMVRQLQRQLEDTQNRLTALQAEPKRRADRRLEIPKRVAELTETRARIEQEYAQAQTLNPPAPLSEAMEVLHQFRLQNVQQQIEVLQDELAYYDAATDLLPSQIELAQLRTQRVTDELTYWTRIAGDRRREAAEQDLEEKTTKASEVPEELKPLAVRNLELSGQRQELAERIESVRADLNETNAALTRWREQLDRVQDLIQEEAGVTESVGSLLREQQSSLPDLRELQKRQRANHTLVYEIRSANFAVNEELIQLQNLDRRVAQQREQFIQSGMSVERAEELESEVRTLLEARMQTLKELASEYDKYTSDLVRFNIAQEQYIKLLERYSSFIDQHVLWIRSIPPVNWSDVQAVPEALRRLFNAAGWRNLLQAAWSSVRQSWLLHLAVLLVVVLGFVYRQRGIKQIRELGEEAESRTCRSFGVTARSLLWTFIVSGNVPLILIWVAWILGDLNEAGGLEWTVELEAAAQRSAFVYWPIAFWIHAVRSRGLAESHFNWSETAIRLTRRHLRWLAPVLVPSTALFYLFQSTDHPRWEQSIGRMAMVVASISVAIFFRKMGSPSRGVCQEYLGHHRNSWAYRLRYIWYALLILVPFSFAVLALAGYQYTAQQLSECLYLSVVFLSAVLLTEAVSTRWIMLKRRALAMAQARERLAAGQVAPQEKKSGEFVGGVTSNEMVNLHQVNEQTMRLVSSFGFIAAVLGLYLIWVDVLPALERLNNVTLWQTSSETSTAPLDTGTTAPLSSSSPTTTSETVVAAPAVQVTRHEWITLGNLVGSIVFLVMTWIAVRNIPGLLEIVILQHLPLDAAVRYAITTVTRYALILVGLALAFGTIGIGWSKIQWLVAGVSVGLGFGLQEIFANFISGLILLFERPLRAGDIVTVGDVTGKVLQIKTRATTIQDWDRKELVVPNKEFITSRLLNWTLTDTINRLVVPVGVAYGSDPAQVRELLMKVAMDHPLVMDDPEPNVTFDLFGDSALNFTLRCYLATLDDRLKVTHELHEMIYRRLHEAGVTIPFPQRDIHIHSQPGAIDGVRTHKRDGQTT